MVEVWFCHQEVFQAIWLVFRGNLYGICKIVIQNKIMQEESHEMKWVVKIANFVIPMPSICRQEGEITPNNCAILSKTTIVKPQSETPSGWNRKAAYLLLLIAWYWNVQIHKRLLLNMRKHQPVVM